MFPSRTRPILYPQLEHSRLAGTLALLWGNDRFAAPLVAAPPIARNSLALGVGLHDRGYGPLDADSLLELPEPRWIEITRRGFYGDSGDPAADLITKLHLRRLVSGDPTPARRALLSEMDAAIAAHATTHGLDLALFRKVDALTRLCDMVAFAFCFEEPAEGVVEVSPHWDDAAPVAIRYTVTPAGDFAEPARISLAPWPLRVDRHEGYLLAYRQEGYPARLEPLAVTYVVERADER
jgi:Protein of unknown function (DUF3891)